MNTPKRRRDPLAVPVSCRCLVVGCGRPIPETLFLCRPHWMALPFAEREKCNAAWQGFKHGTTTAAELRDARRRAVESIAAEGGGL